jgi:protein-S-isoprenylcysteine O-methyltransferase Ste14
MKTKSDHPGVYFPPPFIYVAAFLLSIFMQKKLPFSNSLLESNFAVALGVLFAITGLNLILPAVIKFSKTKNTLIPNKSANSLQTAGIYSISRNPMYLGLLVLYIGIGCFKGNVWSFILIPMVILLVTKFVIRNEEEYLSRAFGIDYIEYQKKVKRWI